jgi:hypothetical protein
MRIGSLVICISGGVWYDVRTGNIIPGPRLNEICTVSAFPKPGYINLEEYPDLDEEGHPVNYHMQEFREIQPPMNIDIDSIIEEKITI